MLFKDREEAGRRLSERLAPLRKENPVVFALPRGGVPVAYEVARALGAPMDVMVARKLGAPGRPEFGIGAIAPGGIRILNPEAIRMLHLSEPEIEAIIAQEERELERRLRRFRGGRFISEIEGRTVILVDDGLATGVTAQAAIRALRRAQPQRMIYAAPVCASETAQSLTSEADEVVCLEIPGYFGAVSLWYRNFDQTSDSEVIALLDRARREAAVRGAGRGIDPKGEARRVAIAIGPILLEGDLRIPAGAKGLILFAHGSGSSRFNPRNLQVADHLYRAGLATLLFDLLTAREEQLDQTTAALRFNIGLLSERLVGVTDWVSENEETRMLRVGYFGASTGAAAALISAARRPDRIGAIVSRGGRPDLAGPALAQVRAPTLLIVGEEDRLVIDLNRDALARLKVEKELRILPGVSPLFEEPGALEQVAQWAGRWFARHLSVTGKAQAA
ncbi:MAG: phosphoribosyltransferase [Nitrospirae bacterium]|nr:phosphoribosyltransferase [Candidatus Manganitrophaceae bacterium]